MLLPAGVTKSCQQLVPGHISAHDGRTGFESAGSACIPCDVVLERENAIVMVAHPVQEDAHAVCLNIDESFPTGFFAVFDGHGGKEVARFCAIYMVRHLQSINCE